MKLILDQITKEYDSIVLNGISHSFASGRLYVIKGVSGSGKSTLLHILSGIDSDFQGGIQNDAGQNMSTEQLHAQSALMSQASLLLSGLTVQENLELISADRERIEQLCTMYHINSRLSAYPEQLSGGERQRISCIRALLRSPSVLLADEPTASLDHDNSQQLAEMLNQLKSNGITVIVATHEHYFDDYADEILMLKHGELHIEKETPEHTETEPNERCFRAQKSIPIRTVIKRNSGSFCFRRLAGYIIMFLMLYTVIILASNTEQLMTGIMSRRYPINVLNINAGAYSQCSFQDSTEIYENYAMQDGDISALYLPKPEDSVLNINGMLLYGSYPERENEVLLSYDLAQEICPDVSHLGCTFTFCGQSYIVSGVVHPFDNSVIDLTFTAVELYDSDAYYFRKYGKIVFIPYQTISEHGTLIQSEIIRVRYPELYRDLSLVDKVRKETFGGQLSLFDGMIQDTRLLSQVCGIGIVLLFFICFGISCIFMGAQIGIELFYRRREIGYMQIFGVSKRNIVGYIQNGYGLRITAAGITALLFAMVILIVLHILFSFSILISCVFCMLFTGSVIGLYLWMVRRQAQKYLKKNCAVLIAS